MSTVGCPVHPCGKWLNPASGKLSPLILLPKYSPAASAFTSTYWLLRCGRRFSMYFRTGGSKCGDARFSHSPSEGPKSGTAQEPSPDSFAMKYSSMGLLISHHLTRLWLVRDEGLLTTLFLRPLLPSVRNHSLLHKPI